MSVAVKNKWYKSDVNWVVAPKGYSPFHPIEKMMMFCKHCVIREPDGWCVKSEIPFHTIWLTYSNWTESVETERLTIEQFAGLCDLFIEKRSDYKDHKVYKNLMLFPNIEEKKKWWEKNGKTEN